MKKHKWKILIISFFCTIHSSLFAQNTFKAIISDTTSGERLFGVVAVIRGTTHSSATDSMGYLELSDIPNGDKVIQLSYIGYTKRDLVVSFPLINTKVLAIHLSPEQAELEEVLVTSTRTNSRIDDAPIKVEVLGLEELHEESSIKPGNISSILGDVSCVQIQQTSAVSGNSVVRMQGLDGRYTLLLRDGMPSYGGLSGGLSILQIPPWTSGR